ncbi:unnamed protein product [Taenia asiatica]|uniref:MARVEL domain-containing protein n=1 Tax=Taenia asiatica TaxID=60517 RepID=A0A0R3VSV5_TAEAS|nr:unnamed protein product [Taenia asiatica]
MRVCDRDIHSNAIVYINGTGVGRLIHSVSASDKCKSNRLLNIYAFAYDGWICGRLCSQHCFDSNGMVVVLSCLAIALSLSIIVQTVAACIDSDSSASWGLNVSLKVLTCIVAISDVVAICYYYSQLTKPLWNEIAAGVCAGLALAIAITKLTYGYHSCY